MADIRKEIQDFQEHYVGACDGRATERILSLIGLGAKGMVL